MLTGDGRALLAIAVVAGGAGRILGVPELLAVAVGLGLLLILVTALVRLRRLRLEVARTLQPARVSVGDDASIELLATNRSRRPTSVLRLHDRVQGTRGATLQMAPLGPGRSTRARYRLPTDRRGRVRVGPLDVVVGDPLGVAEARVHAAAVEDLVVLPPVEDVLAPPAVSGDDERAVRANRSVTSAGGDLHSLRPYVVGDDLRRVHWRSSARHGDLLVRVDEDPRLGRTTVLLEARRAHTTTSSLDQVVSAAASIATSAHRRGDVLTVATLGGRSAVASEADDLDALIDELAVLDARPDDTIRPTVRWLAAGSARGALVVITTDRTPDEDVEALTPLREGHRPLILVVVGTESPPHPPATAGQVADVVVPVAPGAALRPAWDRAVDPPLRR